MSEFKPSSDPADAEANMEMLAQNEYPGRLAVMGISQDGTYAIQAYALMGRSEGSRDRVFVEDADGIRTIAPNKSPGEMAATPNAPLIYYRAMRDIDGVHIVSNGVQTEPVLWGVLANKSLDEAVEAAPTVAGVDLSSYEPDSPNYTPRITGVTDFRQIPPATSFGFCIARRSPGSDVPTRDLWEPSARPPQPEFQELENGVGYAIQTYQNNAAPGEALPSFEGDEPYTLPLGGTMFEVARNLWDVLNKDNRVALVVKGIDRQSGKTVGYDIINAKQ